MRTTTYLMLAGLLFVAGIGCEESLPPYQEPTDVLVGEVGLQVPDTVLMYTTSAWTNFYPASTLIAEMKLTNVYDDLLEGEALVQGSMMLQSGGTVPRTLVIPLAPGNLLTPPIFQGNVALPPGESADFSTLWTPLCTDGKMLFEGTPYVAEGDSGRIYQPLDCLLSGEGQIFEKVQSIKIEGEMVRLVFRVLEAEM